MRMILMKIITMMMMIPIPIISLEQVNWILLLAMQVLQCSSDRNTLYDCTKVYLEVSISFKEGAVVADPC